MEPKIEIPYTIVDPKPDRPIRDKKVRPHRYTSIIRKKYATEDEHKWGATVDFFHCLNI